VVPDAGENNGDIEQVRIHDVDAQEDIDIKGQEYDCNDGQEKNERAILPIFALVRLL
jgi:hypothetical protein